MLDELTIENLGVIARATFPLAPGLTALTGETGAGKTMILNALSLLRGSKTDTALIRTDAEELVVEGRWHASSWPHALELVADAGGKPDDDGSVITTRTVTKTRSRAHLGGRSVPAATMADFTADLVTVHGQSDQMRLRTPGRQRAALDAFAPATHTANLGEYRRNWEQRAQISSQLATLTSQKAARQQLAALLTSQIGEIEAVDPHLGEFAEVTAQVNRLANAHALQTAVAHAYFTLTGDTLTFGDGGGGTSDFADDAVGVTSLLDQARREVSSVLHDDATLAPMSERLTEIGYFIADIAAELSVYAAHLDASPGQLEQLQARLGALNTLARKHGMPADELAPWAQAASLQLLELSNDDETITELTAALTELDQNLSALTSQITQGRELAAGELAELVTSELSGLGMASSAVEVTVEPDEPGPSGADNVTFWLVPHPGVAPRPIAKGASGGELSRLMLALELTLASRRLTDDAGALPTFVFDEIDAGVGGRAATEIGQRLAELAQLTQVIVVTHLAQVAAFADQQLVVAKTAGETTVSIVAGKTREAEIARMLSGTENSKTALKHARELLATAQGKI